MLDLEFAFTVVSAMAETLMLDLEFAISHGKNFHVGLGLLSTMGKTLLLYLEFAISHGNNFNVGFGICYQPWQQL